MYFVVINSVRKTMQCVLKMMYDGVLKNRVYDIAVFNVIELFRPS